MKTMFRIAAFSLLGCVVSPSLAQETTNANPRITVVRAAHMLDVKSGRMVDNPVIVINGDKITSIAGAVPGNATTIDLPGATLVPGLIDAHTHIIGKGTNFGYQELAQSV